MPNPSTIPSFNPVADSQAIFRVLLNAMARPGTVALLPATDPRCPLEAGQALAALAQTLLDHEVTFAVDSALPQAEAFTHYLTTTTGSRPAEHREADYFFAPGPLEAGRLNTLKRGVLAFPDEGATAIILTSTFASEPDTHDTLQGPGIAATLVTNLAGLSQENLTERDQANSELPRGIDLILVDPSGHVVCLPRTTRITRNAW